MAESYIVVMDTEHEEIRILRFDDVDDPEEVLAGDEYDYSLGNIDWFVSKHPKVIVGKD